MPEADKKGRKERLLRAYARAGLVAYGFVYTLMSLIGFIAAFGLSRRKSNLNEAFRLIYEQPFGKIILGLIGVCMCGYALLRFFQAFKDTRHKGKGVRGLALRFAFFCIAVTYLSLAAYSFRLAIGRPDHSDHKREYAKELLSLPAGRWVVGGVAAGLVITAAYNIYRGVSRKFLKTLDVDDTTYKAWYTRFGMAGYCARGIVFGVIGYFVLRVAIDADPRKAQGTEGAFNFLREHLGEWLMAMTSLGFLCFGLFMFVRAKYEKMNFDIEKR